MTPVSSDNMSIEVSFLIPCLNEKESLAAVLDEIHSRFGDSDLQYEVIVADNGSTDDSREIAVANGARVVEVPVRGYGAAILGGMSAARGAFCVMGDADGSYPFAECMPFIQSLREGADIVVGNRFKGGIEAGAMPWLHRYVGNPFLSALGRFLHRVPVGDFHCGLRAFRIDSVNQLGLKTPGMEFASSMLVQGQQAGLRICEVPTRLRKDLRSRPPHLRTWRDGWRHLRFLLAYSPAWVFLVPASVTVVALMANVLLAIYGPLSAGGVELSYRSSLVSLVLALVSSSGAWAFVIGRALARPGRRRIPYSIELMAGTSLIAGFSGVGVVVVQYTLWAQSGFGELPFGRSLLIAVLGCLLIGLGGISFFGSLLYGLARSVRS